MLLLFLEITHVAVYDLIIRSGVGMIEALKVIDVGSTIFENVLEDAFLNTL